MTYDPLIEQERGARRLVPRLHRCREQVLVVRVLWEGEAFDVVPDAVRDARAQEELKSLRQLLVRLEARSPRRGGGDARVREAHERRKARRSKLSLIRREQRRRASSAQRRRCAWDGASVRRKRVRLRQRLGGRCDRESLGLRLLLLSLLSLLPIPAAHARGRTDHHNRPLGLFRLPHRRLLLPRSLVRFAYALRCPARRLRASQG